MATSYAPNIVSDGIVACWDAAGKRSYPGTGTAWNDLVGENNGTLENGPTFDSANGGSIVFDGTDDTVACGNGDFIEGLTEITACCWVFVEDAGSAYPKLISKGHASGFDSGMTRSGLVVWCYIGSNELSAYMPGFEEWIYFVVRYKSGETSGWQLWINGESKNTSTLTAAIPSDSSNLFLGNKDDDDRGLAGKIASASIYNRALSAAEIVQNYDATKWRFQ